MCISMLCYEKAHFTAQVWLFVVQTVFILCFAELNTLSAELRSEKTRLTNSPSLKMIVHQASSMCTGSFTQSHERKLTSWGDMF